MNKINKSDYSFSYSMKGVFIIDNNTQKKTKISIHTFNKATTIKGKFLGKSFVIKSVMETHFRLNKLGVRVRRNDTMERIVYVDNKKLGKLTTDFADIQVLNALAGIPKFQKLGDYKVVYFRPFFKKVELFKEKELIGYTKQNKKLFDLYAKNEDDLPLLLAITLATFDGSFL